MTRHARRSLQVSFALALVAALTTTAFAKGEVTPEVFTDNVEKQEKDKKQEDPGWQAFIDLGASVAMNANNSVVGKPEGVSIQLGATVTTGVSYIKELHDWRTRLALALAFTQTPVIDDQFVKTTDTLVLDSAYYLRLVDWVGPFARFGLETALLAGEDVQPADVTYQRVRLDGTTEDIVGRTLGLTDPFTPLTLKQSLGAFARPYQTREAEVEFRLGLGAREVIADGQWAFADDGDTADVIEIQELRTYYEVGAEIRAQVGGSFQEDKISYLLFGEVLIPFWAAQLDSDDRGLLDLTNVDMGVKLTFKLVEWASLNYEFKAMLQPQLSEDWQVQNIFLLTFGYSFKTDTPKKEDAK